MSNQPIFKVSLTQNANPIGAITNSVGYTPDYQLPEEYLFSPQQLKEKYTRSNWDIIQHYKPADVNLTIHEDDPDLKPVSIPIARIIIRNFEKLWGRDTPVPMDELFPKINTIDGWGLPYKQQKFKRQTIPNRLQQLINNSDLTTIDEIWDVLDKNQSYYKAEIDWIALQWHRRLYGYWCYIKGKLTYIDGWQYMYCNFWRIDIGLPEYRSRDRKFFIFARFCYTTTDAYYRYQVTSKEGKLMFTNNDKELEAAFRAGHTITEKATWIDFGKRLCVGFVYPKHRREGATYKAEFINFEIISRSENVNGGIQSQNGDKAEEAFKKHLVYPYQTLEFFFKPMTKGTSDPQDQLLFAAPIKKAQGGKTLTGQTTGLRSKINWATGAQSMFYDGYKMFFFHDDEIGKLQSPADCYERHQITFKCLAQGNGSEIHGFTIKTSTVGEMSQGGGKRMLTLCSESKLEETRKNGMTISGMYTYFNPAYDGLDGFIDEYGNSIIEDPLPDEEVYNLKNKRLLQGAKSFLEEKSQGFIERGDHESLLAHNQDLREHPRRFKHCFLSAAGETGMPTALISGRIQELTFNLGLRPIKGNFQWIDPRKWEKGVLWKPDENGRFNVSLVLNMKDSNAIMFDGNTWVPRQPGKFVGCGDPFKFTKKVGQRLSNGGGAVFYPRDINEDPEDNIKKWKSHRFVCTYNERIDNKHEYFEDMLKMIIYYGCFFYPENNLPELYEWIEDKGFGGMLLYRFDSFNQRLADKPGFNSDEKTKQTLFQAVKNYLELHVSRETHIDLLSECVEIQGIEEMTFYDLFTAAGGALLGAQQPEKLWEYYREASGFYTKQDGENVDTSELFAFYAHMR